MSRFRFAHLNLFPLAGHVLVGVLIATAMGLPARASAEIWRASCSSDGNDGRVLLDLKFDDAATVSGGGDRLFAEYAFQYPGDYGHISFGALSLAREQGAVYNPSFGDRNRYRGERYVFLDFQEAVFTEAGLELRVAAPRPSRREANLPCATLYFHKLDGQEGSFLRRPLAWDPLARDALGTQLYLYQDLLFPADLSASGYGFVVTSERYNEAFEHVRGEVDRLAEACGDCPLASKYSAGKSALALLTEMAEPGLTSSTVPVIEQMPNKTLLDASRKQVDELTKIFLAAASGQIDFSEETKQREYAEGILQVFCAGYITPFGTRSSPKSICDYRARKLVATVLGHEHKEARNACRSHMDTRHSPDGKVTPKSKKCMFKNSLLYRLDVSGKLLFAAQSRYKEFISYSLSKYCIGSPRECPPSFEGYDNIATAEKTVAKFERVNRRYGTNNFSASNKTTLETINLYRQN